MWGVEWQWDLAGSERDARTPDMLGAPQQLTCGPGTCPPDLPTAAALLLPPLALLRKLGPELVRAVPPDELAQPDVDARARRVAEPLLRVAHVRVRGEHLARGRARARVRVRVRVRGRVRVGVR